MRSPKTLISIAILVLVAVHVVPVLHAGMRKRMWPILDWAMYKDPKPDGPVQMDKKRLLAVTARGDTATVDKEVVGVSSFVIDRLYTKPMRAGDATAARALFTRLNRTRDDPFVELRLESETYSVTDEGIVKIGRASCRERV